MIDRRLAICALVSVGGHCVFAAGINTLPSREQVTVARPIEIRVVEPPPPPPPKPPEPEPIEPPKEIHEKPRTKPSPSPRVARTAPTPVDTPNVDHVPTTSETTTAPVYGFQMSSSSSSGPAVAQGNTTRVAPSTGAPGPAKPLAAAAAVEVTKMPVPLGRCSGKYTEAAKTAGVEGTVVLDLVVDETGRARSIEVKERLPHGLTEAAVAALRACKFTPGEKAGQPVAVRVRSFKIRFFLQDA